MLSNAGWFGLGIGVGAVVLACVVIGLWTLVRCRRTAAMRAGRPRVVRHVDVEATESATGVDSTSTFALISEDAHSNASADDESAVELVDLTNSGGGAPVQSRYMDTPDAILDSYDERMMQSVPLK
jgi:hypothetical protein